MKIRIYDNVFGGYISTDSYSFRYENGSYYPQVGDIIELASGCFDKDGKEKYMKEI